MTADEYFRSKGFKIVGFTAPYTFYQNENMVIGICVTCGILIRGKTISKSIINTNEILTIPNHVRYKWKHRSIQELEKFINEGTPVK